MKKIIITGLLVLSSVYPVYAADDVEKYGDVGQVALPVAAVLITAMHDDTEGVGQFAKAFVSTIAATYVLKYAVDSKRPNGGDHSFPSGHTSAAFAAAGFIQQRYGWGYGFPAYAAAALVGVSRLTSNNHYIQDVIAGAAIGIGANLIFTKKFERNVIISPVILNEGVGGVIVYSW